MTYQNIFNRYEMKYLITKEQRRVINEGLLSHMNPDKFGKSTICNVYFDTPDKLLIRRSIEKPVYKEKLRARSYGVAAKDSIVFLEVKKKYKSVVYKRRVSLSENELEKSFFFGNMLESSTQIRKEINYCRKIYENLEPSVFISYEREAFYAKTDYDFRITFDNNILWRDYDISLCAGIYGDNILKDGEMLMEIKTGAAIPLWMTEILSKNHIYSSSFSKYGNAFKAMQRESILGGLCYAG